MNILKRHNFRLVIIVFVGMNLLFINICGAAVAPPNPPDIIADPPLVIVNPTGSVINDISVGSGGIKHGATVTIMSSVEGFGSKGTAQDAPVLWDDCSGTDYLDLWDGGWPTASHPNSTPRYAASGSIGGVDTPHGNVSQYLAARSYDEGGDDTYYNNMVWKVIPSITKPSYIYVSWYQRNHPDYDPGDNYKWFGYSGGNSPYNPSGSWYASNSSGLGGSLYFNDNQAGLVNQWCDENYSRDYLCNSKYLARAIDISTQWVKFEVEIYVTDQNDGWFNVYQNGDLKVNQSTSGTGTHSYNGPTDATITGSPRNIAIGGYNRLREINNWRLFNDLYIDYTLARVIIGNDPSYSKSTVKEVQIPQSWSNESISFTVNQGTFSAGDQAYLFVIDSEGQASAGHPITIGVN